MDVHDQVQFIVSGWNGGSWQGRVHSEVSVSEREKLPKERQYADAEV